MEKNNPYPNPEDPYEPFKGPAIQESCSSKRISEQASSNSDQDDSEESLILNTKISRAPAHVPLAPKTQTEQNQQSSNVPSFHLQKSLNVNGAFAKIMFEIVKKGDISAVKQQEDRIGLDVQYLCDDSLKQNALFTAMLIKDEDQAIAMVDWLVAKGCQLNTTDLINQTCLYYAARDGKVKIIQHLISIGIDFNHVDTFGQTAFFYACREGMLDVCKLLQQAGNEIDAQDNEGQTPLYYSIRRGKYEICEWLIQSGANVMHSDRKNDTPYILAKRNSKHAILKLLVDNGAQAINESPQPVKPNKRAKSSTKKQSVSVETTEQSPNHQGIQQQAPADKKQTKAYVLTYLQDGEYLPLTDEQMKAFSETYPHIAKYFQEPEYLNTLQLPSASNILYESWDLVAKRLLSTVSRVPQAKIFLQPVDPETQQIPDYTEVVKNAVDFSLIKQRLNNNHYHSMQQFIDDMQLVFDNCDLYNGADSSTGRQCARVREEFKRIYEQLNVEFYIL